MFVRSLTAVATALLLAGPAHSQAVDPHAGHLSSAPSTGEAAPSTLAFEAANAKMHKNMAIAFTGNADQDFLAGMVPHHQGAIDMAEVVLKYGKDPKVRKLARAIIKAQKQEIAMMKAWQAARP